MKAVLWNLHVVGNASAAERLGRAVNLDAEILRQAQHFVILDVRISLARRFVNLEVQNLCIKCAPTCGLSCVSLLCMCPVMCARTLLPLLPLLLITIFPNKCIGYPQSLTKEVAGGWLWWPECHPADS